MKTIKVITRDSLGHIIARYETKVDADSYARLKALADDDPDLGMVAIVDVEIDGELGCREYLL